MALNFYIDKLQSIRPDRSSGRAKPHKVCMMFAVMDLIEQGYITENKIHYDDVLKQRFSWHFAMLKQGNDKDSPFLPFYHLKSSGIWHLSIASSDQKIFDDIKSLSDSTIKKLIEYAYVDKELFDYLKSPLTAPLCREALTSNLDSLEEQYIRWSKSLGKSDKTIKNYTGALKNSIPNWLNDAGVAKQNLLSIASPFEYQEIVSKAYQVQEFVDRDKRGKGMYSAAIKSYQTFLNDITQTEVQQDIDLIIQDETITDTEKSMMVNTRIGQGKFRDNLIDYWKGCAVTHYSNNSFLIASHIKPWSTSSNTERLDPFNGLLLLANIDKAFDLGYISFKDSGKILISDELDDYQSLGINADMTVLLQKQHQDYLAFHRERRFK